MEGKLLTHLKVFIPRVNEFPLKMAQKWAEKTYARAPHTSGQLRKAVGTQKAVKEKIFKPLLEVSKRFINPDFVSKSELTAQQIRSKMENKMDKTAAKKYLEGEKRAFQTVDGVPAKYIKERLPFGALKYAEKMTFGTWRLIGPLASTELSRTSSNEGEGALNIVMGWLTGKPTATEFIRKQDEVLAGAPFSIINPALTPRLRGQFKRKLRNRLKHSFREICVLYNQPDEIRIENDLINQLVNEFARKDLVPFQTGGASHLDFVPHPKTAIFHNSPEVLAVRSKIREFFLGEPLDMSLFTARPQADSPRWLDMHLDLQVARSDDPFGL